MARIPCLENTGRPWSLSSRSPSPACSPREMALPTKSLQRTHFSSKISSRIFCSEQRDALIFIFFRQKSNKGREKEPKFIQNRIYIGEFRLAEPGLVWQHIQDLHWPWEMPSANFIPSHLLVWAAQPFKGKYPSNTSLNSCAWKPLGSQDGVIWASPRRYSSLKATGTQLPL